MQRLRPVPKSSSENDNPAPHAHEGLRVLPVGNGHALGISKQMISGYGRPGQRSPTNFWKVSLPSVWPDRLMANLALARELFGIRGQEIQRVVDDPPVELSMSW